MTHQSVPLKFCHPPAYFEVSATPFENYSPEKRRPAQLITSERVVVFSIEALRLDAFVEVVVVTFGRLGAHPFDMTVAKQPVAAIQVNVRSLAEHFVVAACAL